MDLRQNETSTGTADEQKQKQLKRGVEDLIKEESGIDCTIPTLNGTNGTSGVNGTSGEVEQLEEKEV